MNPYELRYEEARRLLDSKELSSRELCDSVVDRIEECEPDVHAFVSLRERARILREAEAADSARLRGKCRGPLAGVPVAIKDNIAYRGLPTTAGSRSLEGYVSPYDATAVRHLLRGGAIVTGKTNLDEFGMGSSCESSAFGATRNPWDLTAVPGGSSGGSAAAVSSGMSTLALGTDTGGSVRQPAGFCGVVGLLPSYGLVSRYGLVAFASSLDQIGPISRDVAGAAAALSVIVGRDELDSTSLSAKTVVEDAGALTGLRIGLVEESFSRGLDADVESVVKAAVGAMRDAGAEIVSVSLPLIDCAVAAYHIVADAEASTNLARYDGVGYGLRAGGRSDVVELHRRTRAEGFGAEVKRRIILGTFVLSAGYRDRYYGRAQGVRRLIAAEFDRAFRGVDLMLTPTSPGTAFGLGERVGDPLAMYMSDVYTVPANLAGIPAVSLPCGRDPAGKPVGLQLLARRLHEGRLLRAAAACEEVFGFPRELPTIGGADGQGPGE